MRPNRYRVRRLSRRHSRQNGFGLVAALFVMIVIAATIAAMMHLASVQHTTASLSLQQARAYQAARAGLEWGVSRATKGVCSEEKSSFKPEGFNKLFRVEVSCSETDPIVLSEERIQNAVFYTITSEAQYSNVASPDYVYRSMAAEVEKPLAELESEGEGS